MHLIREFILRMTKKEKKTKKELKFINYRVYITIISILAFCLIAINAMYRISPVFAQTYCTTAFTYLVHVIGGINALLPFSLAEILLGAAVILVLYCIIRLIVTIIRHHKPATIYFFKYRLVKYLLNLACIILVCSIIYSLNCGILYKRLSFAVCSNMHVKDRSTEELIELCNILIDDANRLSGEIKTDEDGLFTAAGIDVREDTVTAMLSLEDEYPFLPDFYPKAKPVIFDKILSYCGITGYYSPFTLEANYNDAVPDVEMLFTVCHELAHTAGFIHEDEASFIAYRACMNSGSPEFMYSGTIIALIDTMNACFEVLPADEYHKLISGLDEQPAHDINNQSVFWSQYDDSESDKPSVSDVAENLNNAYIQANGDKEGTGRYGMVVDLLLAYYFN